jgi:hypothetical protein
MAMGTVMASTSARGAVWLALKAVLAVITRIMMTRSASLVLRELVMSAVSKSFDAMSCKTLFRAAHDAIVSS